MISLIIVSYVDFANLVKNKLTIMNYLCIINIGKRNRRNAVTKYYLNNGTSLCRSKCVVFLFYLTI